MLSLARSAQAATVAVLGVAIIVGAAQANHTDGWPWWAITAMVIGAAIIVLATLAVAIPIGFALLRFRPEAPMSQKPKKRQQKKRDKKYDPSKRETPEQQPTAVHVAGGAKIKGLIMRGNKAIGFSKPMRWLHLSEDATAEDVEVSGNIDIAKRPGDSTKHRSGAHTEDDPSESA